MRDELKKTRLAKVGGVLFRLATVLLAVTIVGWMLERVGTSMDKSGPAGFRRGVIQGALMPMALPNLLIGRDVTIYSQNNSGVPYKLGYTMGVNGCGALFFGFFFWRLNRWRRRTKTMMSK